MNKLTICCLFFLSLFLFVTCYALHGGDTESLVYDAEVEKLYDSSEATSEKPHTIETREIRMVDDETATTPELITEDQSEECPQNISENDTIHNDIFDSPVSKLDLPEQIIHRKGYTVSYNKKTMQPNWVAWHLTAEHTVGEWTRPSGNAFHEDTDVKSPRASNYDYKGSGWSRGHLCPAGDNKWDDKAMYESFLLTNICPQHIQLNSGDWNDIEQECRRWAQRYGDIYIVCGPIFYRQEHETIGMHRIPVPEAFFKVVVCLNGTPKGIGFICKNTDGHRKTDYYVNPIRQVERITGYKFFPNLTDSIKDIIFESDNINIWYQTSLE